ncbi:Enamine deaminase RidA, house cleaning of reactive enamine intermediates, YjgF/YER057c/UK114 family [Agrobacterium fabrum]|uniref:Enamine deaminase RidA, house cleaning of reactive enamine intermediates, YjgF/YER057c/UK114 family n=1 Tax=Agrobacterium fabrum TaxID=1176649 RepID=A0A7Z7FRZ4_9HYPH|nr:Rid family hydrolase [Agrobacterium fabrum]SDK32721.1 Enamine deaminase RidA, house cleaning of reactive enamine intermediates, YjgF/YER057c/UK114 family [Agrobacterium fabrum]
MPITTRTGHAGRTYISTGSSTEKWVNYSRAVRHGDWVFVSNTSGYHYDEDRIDTDIASQTRQMIVNVTDALDAAGAKPQDIVRAVIFCPQPDEFHDALDIISEFLADIKPTVTATCSPLAAPSLKIEMEVTALLGDAS